MPIKPASKSKGCRKIFGIPGCECNTNSFISQPSQIPAMSNSLPGQVRRAKFHRILFNKDPLIQIFDTEGALSFDVF